MVAVISNFIVSRWQEKSICWLANDYPISVTDSFITSVELQEHISQAQYFGIQTHKNMVVQLPGSNGDCDCDSNPNFSSVSPLNENSHDVKGSQVGSSKYTLTWVRFSKRPHKTLRWRLLSMHIFGILNCPVTKTELVCRMQSLFEGWSKTVKLISPEAKRKTQSSPSSIPGVWYFFDLFFQTWKQVYL